MLLARANEQDNQTRWLLRLETIAVKLSLVARPPLPSQIHRTGQSVSIAKAVAFAIKAQHRVMSTE